MRRSAKSEKLTLRYVPPVSIARFQRNVQRCCLRRQRSNLGDRDKLEGIAKGLLQYETLDSSQIKEIVEHGRLINPPASGGLLPGKKMPAQNPLGSLGLTPREAEVLNWIAQGKSNYEIGVILTACTGTICKHVEHILAKLNVENRTAAAVMALAALASAKK